MARMDHCLRIFALAWPLSSNTPVITKDQCRDYQSALRCLERSGHGQCPSLQQYVSERTAHKDRHRQLLDTSCAGPTDDQLTTDSAAPHAHALRILPTTVVSLGATLLLGRLIS